MKKMKKVLAMIVSLAMVLAMSLTAFAASEGDPAATATKPTADDKATATVKNVEANATVTAYQIVKANYNENGFLGYVRADGITETTLVDLEVPTSTEITSIAANKDLLDTLKKEAMTAGTADDKGLATFTANLAPGYWVVVVTGSDRQVVYNPMLVGVYYSKSGSDNTLTNDPVDATTNWSLNSEPAYAKSNTPDFDKKITGSTTEDGDDNTDSTLESANNKGNDVAIGDIVQYQIDTAIPAYSDSYTKVKVNITDQLSKGLELQGTPVVKVDGNVVEAGADTFTYTKGTPENGYTIAFVSAFALAHSGEPVVVTYEAKLTEAAATNFDPNTNTATFEYSNDPQDENNTETIKKETYTYTFEIDGNLYGDNEGEWNKVTEELLKGYKKETTETGKWHEFGPLAGAEFKLTNNSTGKVYTTTSDAKGLMNFKGLDAGEYTLVETKAPEGYTLNDTPVPVVITAEYNEDGTLKNYNITVDGKNSSTYTATYKTSDAGIVDIDKIETSVEVKEENLGHDISDSYIFWNTKLSELPSTGGIGTTIFTIGGCIIMIIAAGLFFASRRKKAAN